MRHLKLEFSCPAYRDVLLQLHKQLGIKFFRPSRQSEPGVHMACGAEGNLYFDNDEYTVWIFLKSRSVL